MRSATLFLFSSLVVAIVVAIVSPSEYPIFSQYFGFGGAFRSFFSPYRAPELFITSITLITFIFVCLGYLLTLQPRLFGRNERLISLLILILLFCYSVEALLSGRDHMQIFLMFSTFSLLPAFVYSAPADLFIPGARKFDSLRIIAIASLTVSLVLLLINSLLVGAFTLDRIVGRLSYLYLIYVLFCVILILTRPPGKRDILISKPFFFLSLLFLTLSGSRSSIVSLLVSFLLIFIAYIFLGHLRVGKFVVQRAIALSGFIAFILPLPFLSSLFLTFARPDSEGFFKDSYRSEQLQCFLSSIASNPILGAGLSSVPSCWTHYLDNVSRVIVELEFFNLYFQLGVLYALIILLYLFLSLRYLHAYARDTSATNSSYYLFASVCLVALPASSFFSPVLFSFPAQFFILIVIFMATCPCQLQRSEVV